MFAIKYANKGNEFFVGFTSPSKITMTPGFPFSSWRPSFMLRRCEMMIAPTTGSSRTRGQNCGVKTCLISLCMIWWRPVSFLAKHVRTQGHERNEIFMPSALRPFMKSVFSHSECLSTSGSMIFTTIRLRIAGILVVSGNKSKACRKAGDAMRPATVMTWL